MRWVGDTRGQTLQDFAVGVGIFLIAFVFVLSLFPGLLTPFQSSASGAERAQAEQVSTQMLNNLSAGSQPNHLDAAAVASVVSPSRSESELLDRYGLPITASINITVETLNGTRNIYRTNNDVDSREVATSARIVTLTGAQCEPACRLVVRVW